MSASAGPDIITDGLVLCFDAGNRKSYPGSGNTWRDLAGRGLNGTLINGPTFNSSNGGSIVFDGSNDFVNCGDNSSLQFGTSNLTWAAWVKTANSNLNGNIIGKRNTDGIFPMITLGVGTLITSGSGFTGTQTKKIHFALRSSGTNQYVGNTNNDIIDGNWKYIVMVRNSGALQIYSNGVNQNFTTIHNVGTGVSTNISLIGVNCLIGATTNGAGADAGAVGFLNCNIASVQMYNRSLTPQEVLQNYNATKGRFGLA
jgi:hypothetical protein